MITTRADGVTTSTDAPAREAVVTTYRGKELLEKSFIRRAGDDVDLYGAAKASTPPVGATDVRVDDGQVVAVYDPATGRLLRIRDSLRVEEALRAAPQAASPTYAPVMNGVREHALQIVRSVMPAPLGSEAYDRVTQNRHRETGYSSAYSSCGDLPAFMLYELGSRDPELVNRTAPDLGEWEVGKNISKLVGRGRELGAWVDANDGGMPNPGDVVLIGDFNAGEMEHVMIFGGMDESGKMISYDFGQPHGQENRRIVSGDRIGGRRIVGWLSLDAVPGLQAGTSSGGIVGWLIAAAAAVGGLLWWRRRRT